MAFRSSTDSDDPDVILLQNDTLLDQSSSFINHVSISPFGDDDDDDDRSHNARYWRQPFWKRLLLPSTSQQRIGESVPNRLSEQGSCLQSTKMRCGRRKSLRWCMRLGLGALLVLYDMPAPVQPDQQLIQI